MRLQFNYYSLTEHIYKNHRPINYSNMYEKVRFECNKEDLLKSNRSNKQIQTINTHIMELTTLFVTPERINIKKINEHLQIRYKFTEDIFLQN